MKVSNLFGQTLRHSPSDAGVESHKLLVRAGYIRPLGAGIFTYLHLAKQSLLKIESIMREEMNNIGGQEISMPVVQPADILKETGRYYKIGSEIGRFKDINSHDMVLAMTHEEVIADLARREIKSYKQLPRLVYHFQTKWRDDTRPRRGLICVREFVTQDSYSLDLDMDGLDRQYRAHCQAYHNIFHRCGLDVTTVESDYGMMGGDLAHEFIYRTPTGEEKIISCVSCGYTANHQVARFSIPSPSREELKPIAKVHTPECKTIENLANFLNVPKDKTAKVIFLIASYPTDDEVVEKFIFVIIRGDLELNETKLANTIGTRNIRPATDEEITSAGATPGYASAISLKGEETSGKSKLKVIVIVDLSITISPNLIAGANEVDYHYLNTNFLRDYKADIVADLSLAKEGYACPKCGAYLLMSFGVEIGNTFRLGTWYSETLGCKYIDKDGNLKPVFMGSYGISMGRLLTCIAEEHHDEAGLVWPVSVAPYHVQLVSIRGKGVSGVEDISNTLYTNLQNSGVDVLYDDRDESAGIKFADADLMGLPIRLTIGHRTINDGLVEMKLRNKPEKRLLPVDATVASVNTTLDQIRNDILKNNRPGNIF